tara:strand:+ start:1077 stop:1385 length:309 start_codon:yes stop_codon:yes gene_type:complete
MGRPQKPATKRKIAKAMTGKNNPAWKDGRRAYRRIVGAKPGEGVHHKDGDSKNNSKNNLKRFKLKGKGRSAHEKTHERGKNFRSGGGRKKLARGYKAKRLKK